MKMLIIDRERVQVVASHFGVNRSTIWRWHKKWQEQNQNIQLFNEVRWQDHETSRFRLDSCKWNIPSIPSIPKNPHRLSQELVELVLDVREQLGRCAEVVWHYVNEIYNPVTGAKRYIYTVIDLYTRMAYARVYHELRPSLAVNTILEAEQYFGFKFKMVQSDNGPEFSSYFENGLTKQGIKIRHTRLGRPNDNAHIERFNRTLQEECTGNYYLESEPLIKLDKRILLYIDFCNYKRVHLGISYRTPAEMLQRF